MNSKPVPNSDEETIGVEILPLIDGAGAAPAPVAKPLFDSPARAASEPALRSGSVGYQPASSQSMSALEQTGPGLNADQLENSIFANKYEVMDLLGRGGMSVVYRARHLAMGKICALKVLHVHLAHDDVSIRRFRQEAQASATLNHPGIVSVSDCGEGEDGMPYLVMDYVEGVSLSDLLKAEGPLTLERFLLLMQQVASALAHAHESSIVHRDLKPSNIMICNSGGKEQARIVDFGIAKILSQSSEGAQQLTQTGEVFGSPLYMSPEQCSGSAIDQRTDVYALGCVMYEALSGKLPHRGNTVIETMHKHVNEPPPPLVAAQIPEEERHRIELILLRCLAKLPEDRYQKVDELESELRQLSMRTGTGIFKKLAGAWDLASAKRRAARKSKLPLLVASLATSMLSVVMLLLGLNQARLDLIETEEARDVFEQVAYMQSEYLRLGEATRAYFTSIMFEKSDLPMRKKKFEKAEISTAQSLRALDKVLAPLEKDLKGYDKSSRKRMIYILGKIPETANVGVSSLTRAANFGAPMWTPENIAVAGKLSEVMEEGVDVLHDMMRLARKAENKRHAKFIQTKTMVDYLSGFCLLLNASVMISLIVYFVRGNPERMRRLAEQASKLSRKQGLQKEGDVEKDDVAELDSVLQELATALSEAEEREKALLLKLKEQEKSGAASKLDNSMKMQGRGGP